MPEVDPASVRDNTNLFISLREQKCNEFSQNILSFPSSAKHLFFYSLNTPSYSSRDSHSFHDIHSSCIMAIKYFCNIKQFILLLT